jgi:hypothetical protein
MKLAHEIAKNSLAQAAPRIVEYISDLGGWKKLLTPTLSSDLVCPVCGGSDHGTPYVELVKESPRVWICHNMVCSSNNRSNIQSAMVTPPISKRAILWPLFCEISGIGDIHHDVSFEKVEQSPGKLSFMLKFATNPHGIIFMQGEPGTGKTYASMAICEYFTRKDTSCIFTTQKKMMNDWLDSFKINNNYFEKVTTRNLLVIDDFGTGEVTPAFMSFVMEIINQRMQWKNRGTIITTNLDDKKFGEFCGDALLDRINTGQKFQFKGKTRRTKTIL